MVNDQQIPVPPTDLERKQQAIAARQAEEARIRRSKALIALLCIVVGGGVCSFAIGMLWGVWASLALIGVVVLGIGIGIGLTD